MRHMIRRRPSPALVVVVAALIAALGGTAIAGPSASTSAVSKKKVKKIAKKQVNKKFPIGELDIDEAAVTTQKLRAGSVTGGKLGLVVVRRNDVPLPDGGNVGGNAGCQPGEKMIGGGARIVGPPSPDYTLQSSGPVANLEEVPLLGSEITSWRAKGHNAPGASGATTLVVFAICLP